MEISGSEHVSADFILFIQIFIPKCPISISIPIFMRYQKIIKAKCCLLYTSTFFQDSYQGTEPALYTVKAIKGKTESNYQLPADAPTGYLNIPLVRPEGGTTPSGQAYTYAPNDASIGDVDGDGEYEIILKWDPSNAHDNAHDGYTGPVIFDCYKSVSYTHLDVYKRQDQDRT